MAIELEKIKAWDGQSGTGADARGVIDRNFEKVKDELEAVDAKFSDVEDEIVQLESDVSDYVRNISGNWFTIPGRYVNVNTGILTTTSNPNSITDYLLLDDISVIKIRGRSQSIVALCAFYDENKRFISSIGGSELNNVDVEILREDFPEGAKYFVGNSGQRDTDYLILYTIKDVYEGLKNSIAENKSAMINLDSTITEDGYWRYENDRRFIYPGSGGYKHTTPVAVQLGDEFITSSSVVSHATSLACHVMFDEDMNVIGALSTAAGYKITQELIDAGVRYVSFSYRPDDTPKTLTLRRDVDTSGMYNKISKNESDIKNLHSRVVKLEDETPYISGIVAMGASLMSPENVWFANAVNSLGVISYNKAESGVGHPHYFANKLWRGTFCTDEEFENMDIMAIQFANNSGLDSEVGLMTNASDYTADFDIENLDNQFSEYSSAQNLDYILKFWQKRCFEQKDNPQSKWFGTPHGKPFRVIFVTHWHDARPYYNDAIRIVAERWGCAVCEFDKKIGFSKNQPLPDMTQVSVLYAEDTQEIGGVTYGWHPKRGLHSEYIQGKMAFIFADTIKEHFGLL